VGSVFAPSARDELSEHNVYVSQPVAIPGCGAKLSPGPSYVYTYIYIYKSRPAGARLQGPRQGTILATARTQGLGSAKAGAPALPSEKGEVLLRGVLTLRSL
jgi:hypothetical protein